VNPRTGEGLGEKANGNLGGHNPRRLAFSSNAVVFFQIASDLVCGIILPVAHFQANVEKHLRNKLAR